MSPATADETSPAVSSPPTRSLAPLYLAGFTTAFGAHAIAAGLGVEAGDVGMGLLTFGIILATYDIAEVILKPLFGSLSDRIGAKPVIVGGLVLFAVASLLGVFASGPVGLGLVRFTQGAGASAFSPASSALVARIAGPASAGRYFGKYGSWKGLGYGLGPLIGAATITLGGFAALFAVLTLVALGTAVWVLVAVPTLPILPRPRYTLADLVRQTTERSFLVPTVALAAATGSLGVAVGFIPLLGASIGLPIIVSMGGITVLALASSISQPAVGRLRDSGRLDPRRGIAGGLTLVVVGLLILSLPPFGITLYSAALVLGLGIGITTPLGFSSLAATTPAERMGRTMGSAELGREVGDAGGPLLVGAVATVASVPFGLGALALVVAGSAVAAGRFLPRAGDDDPGDIRSP